MKIGWATCWILVQVILLCGCGEKNEEKTDGRASVEAAPTSSVPSEVEKAIAEIEKDFASVLPHAVTNWVGAVALAHGTAEKIQKLPPALRESYGRKMAQAILSVPIDHLPYYDRSRTLYMMWIMVEEIGRYKVGWKFVWELRVMRLRRLREAIEHARKEKNDWYNRSYITTVSNNLSGYSEFWEEKLAYRVSKSIPPRDHAWMVKEIPEEEYLAIRKRFEEFLGRPIRSYEEIIRAKRERDRQMNLEEERRKAGPDPDPSDVKVDIGNL